ncbi:MAG: hypothetical protein JWO57_1076 [Pseudonocardiales bacterium]|nr:hypothetical protein [Pseudonocardiales bacterium]
MTVVALQSKDIGRIGVAIILGLVVVGLLLGLIITAIVGRVIVLIVVVALGVLVWQQRTTIQDHVKKCQLNMSFLGIHVDAPKDVQTQCAKVSR